MTFFKWNIAAMLVGFILDLIIGDPDGWTHPVIWIGKYNWIDNEPVIYRSLGNYDIEISGGHTNTQPVSIYVWEKHVFPVVVEYHLRLSHKAETIKKMLDNIAARYTNKEEQNYAE